MVFLTKILLFAKPKKPPRSHMRNTFIDSLRLHVRGGNGGSGLPKFGGVGGQGGNVIVTATEETTSLADVIKKFPKKRIIAGAGAHSHKRFILGPPGADAIIEVPTGVSVFKEDGKFIGELNLPGDELVVARGGVGGTPQNGYLGREGQGHVVVLDLKLIADVGLVGFPNAGKSTLLKAISNASPKIAAYPFTTIRPNVGMIVYKDLRQISVADLPGLITGAHNNVGMGHKFLKHVERTKLLVIVVDINGFQLSPQYKNWSCLDTIVLLNKELELYQKEILNKPTILLLNKIDMPDTASKLNEIKEKLTNLPAFIKSYPEDIRPENPFNFEDIIPLSAQKGGEGVNYFKEQVRTLLDLHYEDENKENENESQLRKFTSIHEHGPKLV